MDQEKEPTKGELIATEIMPFILVGINQGSGAADEVKAGIAKMIDNAFKPEHAPTDEKTFGQLKQETDQLCRDMAGLIHRFYNQNHSVELEFHIVSPFKELTGGRKLRMPTTVSAKIIL